MKKFSFYLPDQGETADDAHELSAGLFNWGPKDLAEKAAEHYHDHMDGIEDTWPVRVAVVFEGREHYYLMGREFMPSFYVQEEEGASSVPQESPVPNLEDNGL